MNDETQKLIDAFKRPDGIMDWYKVLDIPRTAPLEQIEVAFQILSATFHPKTGIGDIEGTVRYVLVQKAFEELGDPSRRKKYDSFCRSQYNHTRLLVALDAERQKQQIDKTPTGLRRFFALANTRFKRLALMTFPFFAVIALYSLAHAINHSDDTPLSFFLFGIAAVMCLLIAFTHLGDWINARHD